MAYWLLKTEPSTYSLSDLLNDRSTLWTGVRNYQARNHLRAMARGDGVVIFHTGTQKCAVGLAKVLANPVDDPTAPGEDWVAVDIGSAKAFSTPVSLATIKSSPAFSSMAMLKLSRLSVSPVTAKEWAALLRLAKTTA